MLILTDQSIYYDIAGAIRWCLDTDTTYLPAEMADAIRRIPMITHIVAWPTKFESRLEGLVDIAGEAPHHGTSHRQTVVSSLAELELNIGAIARKAG